MENFPYILLWNSHILHTHQIRSKISIESIRSLWCFTWAISFSMNKFNNNNKHDNPQLSMMSVETKLNWSQVQQQKEQIVRFRKKKLTHWQENHNNFMITTNIIYIHTSFVFVPLFYGRMKENGIKNEWNKPPSAVRCASCFTAFNFRWFVYF